MTLEPSATPPSTPGHLPLARVLAADLADWQVHLHARSFTSVSVELLLRDLRRSVPSALGYSLVLVAEPGLPEVSITVAAAALTPTSVGSRLSFDLPVGHDLTASATFYAGSSGALDELAVMLADTTGFADGGVVLAGAPEHDVEPGVRGLEDHTQVNYAFGVLLARGEPPEEATRHLRRLADRHGSLGAAARHLLSTFLT